MSVLCVSDMMDKDYKQYVLSSVEKEGHISFFQQRKPLWGLLKDNDNNYMDNLLTEMASVYKSFSNITHHKADSDIHLTVSWRKHIREIAQRPMFQELSISCDVSGHDLLTILQTIGKYALIWQRKTETTKAATTTADGTKQTTIVVQTDSGLLVLASGCIGGMFRLYKKNREKYGHFLHPLAKMIVTNKSQSSIPVEQRSRDQGGLYCLSRDFLPPLRLLDHTLRIELSKSKQYGKKLSMVCSFHISLF